jgi:hypothetical protein
MLSSSQNKASTNANGSIVMLFFSAPLVFFCKMPSGDFSSSPHKCPYCQQSLHGICGVLHDPDNLMYQNHCNFCDARLKHQLRAHQVCFPSQIPDNVPVGNN